MPTVPYTLNNDYAPNTQVKASDLNRRANIVSAQLPAAFVAAGLDAGVMPLAEDGPPLSYRDSLNEWAAGAQASFRVTLESGQFVAAAGAAQVRHRLGHLVFVHCETQLTVASVGLDKPYVHLKLAAPNNELAMGLLDSQTGDPPTLFVSEQESEPSCLLLATLLSGSTVADNRPFVAPAALSIAIQNVFGRIEALEAVAGGGEGGEGGVVISWLSQLLYNTANPVRADEYIDGRLTAIEARQTAMEGGPKKFPDELSLLTDLTSAVAVGLFEVNPTAMLRAQMSAVGRGFGKGQNGTPDLSPDTGNLREAGYDAASGLIVP